MNLNCLVRLVHAAGSASSNHIRKQGKRTRHAPLYPSLLVQRGFLGEPQQRNINMRELTGHKVNPANDRLAVRVLDEPGQGNACHHYLIEGYDPTLNAAQALNVPGSTEIIFQNGPIAEDGNGVNGLTHEALLDILIDRMQGFQSGPYASQYNARALSALCEAQDHLQQRTKDRMARDVEGTHTI